MQKVEELLKRRATDRFRTILRRASDGALSIANLSFLRRQSKHRGTLLGSE